MTPMTESSALASSASGGCVESVSTGFHSTTGRPRGRATCCDCSATCASVSSPYRPWLPVTNQTV
jgi:hypothetical protein